MSAPPLRKNPDSKEDRGTVGRTWAPGGVFWRTFFLIALLTLASLIAWYQSFRVLERQPRAQQAGQLVVSIVNLTRSALVHSDPEKRRALLVDLAQNEDIRIYPLEPTDIVEALPDQALYRLMYETVRSQLGSDTRMAVKVNGQAGLWVSFAIDDDGYWVAFDRDRLDNIPRLQWLNWGAVALTLSLIGAVVISRLVNIPLKRLANAAVTIGRGQRPTPLPEIGPREIREANASFNGMVDELERIEADRALLLAGISHDLRTPLTRMRLEVELNPLDPETREAMNSDIEQMDAIIGQFLDYARPMDELRDFTSVDLAQLVRETIESRSPSDDVAVTLRIEPARPVRGHAMELKRVLLNLIENARRYGQTPGTQRADLVIRVSGGDAPQLEVRDHGVGIADKDLERLKRPFTRLDTARSQANGAGLGLAIIERIAQRHRARFELRRSRDGGLSACLQFPAGA